MFGCVHVSDVGVVKDSTPSSSVGHTKSFTKVGGIVHARATSMPWEKVAVGLRDLDEYVRRFCTMPAA